MYLKMKLTGNNFVRCWDGLRKWYQPVLEITNGKVRMSRKRFTRARDAAACGQAVLAGLGRLSAVEACRAVR
jgi:hypothetical protein